MDRPKESNEPALLLVNAARILEDCSLSPELDREWTNTLQKIANTLRQKVKSMLSHR